MIEFELKFAVDSMPDLSALPQVAEKNQIDIYYDTADYTMLRRGIFIRVRDNKKLEWKGWGDKDHLFCRELTFPLDKISEKSDAIAELAAAAGIAGTTGETFSDIDDFIKKCNLQVIAPIKKHRHEYKCGDDMTVALDDADDIGIFLEVEKMIPNESLSVADSATQRDLMTAGLRAHGINPGNEVRIGYVELYLQKHNPAAYELGLFKD